jgi:tyrosine-specific transport protein
MNHHDDGTGVAIALEQIVGSSWITQSSRWFAIFAILTSLLGVSLALMHFLAEAVKGFTKKKPPQFWLVVITYLPPMLIVWFYPSGFSQILSFAGVFVAVLLGILPAMMVWHSRYSKQGIQSGYRVFGGKTLLICVMVFFCYVTYLEVANCLFCQP